MAQPLRFSGPIASFHSTRATPLGIEVTPLLKSCVSALHGEFEETTRFLDHYCELVGFRITYDMSQNPRYEDRARDDYSVFQGLVDQDPILNDRLTMPTFESIWEEVGALLHSVHGGNPFAEGYISYVYGEETYHNLKLQKYEILVFEELQVDSKLSSWIKMFLSCQPRHFDAPYSQPKRMIASDKPGSKTIPSLADAFQLRCFGEPQIFEYISYMGSLAVSVQRWLLAWGDTIHHEEDLEEFVTSVVSEHQSLVSYPLSHYTIIVRRRLAQIDIRNATETLLANVIELIKPEVSGDNHQNLDWLLFKLFTCTLMEKATAQGSRIASEVRKVLEDLGLLGFLSYTMQPAPGWVNNVFLDILFPSSYGVLEDEDDLDELNLEDLLPDVCFEPVGPELKIENYALAHTRASDVAETNCAICIDVMDVMQTQRDEIPVRIKCGHTFHYGCLSTLINGISKFSNLCPNCRCEICARREKRLKSNDDLEDALEQVATTAEAEGAEVVQERDLRDVEGDVVMTDC